MMTLASTLGLASLLSLATGSSLDDLPRRVSLGVSLSPVPADIATKSGLKPGEGLVSSNPTPGLSWEKAGLKAGDILLELDGKAAGPGIGNSIRMVPAGTKVPAKVFRNGKAETVEIVMIEKPRDPGNENYTVSYSHVVSNGNRMRTIRSRPKKSGKHPALMFIQGLSPISYDYDLAGPASLARIDAPILFEFANSGFVTMRVEKPGVGDSEGGPYPDLDYTTELDVYRQALKQLKSDPNVDPDNIFIFGHSMGGSFGPMVACEIPVKGIAVYGTAARTWFEYLLDTMRYQGLVGGESFEQVEDSVRVGARLVAQVFLENRSVDQVKKDHPELAPMAEALFPGGYFNGKAPVFWRQLGATNFSKYWTQCNARVLAVHGASDFVSYEVDHKLIADVVNRAHPGWGKYAKAANSDHLFNDYATEQESLKNWPRGEFNHGFTKMMMEWVKGIMAEK